MNVLQTLSTMWGWAKDHPALVWPMVTLIFTALFKPRTPEAYANLAKKWPRVAAFLQLVAALGIDAPKLIEALSKVRTGKDDPPKPPAPPGVLVMLLLVGALGFGSVSGATSCKPGATPRETARATVLVVADAVKQLDAVCAAIVTAKHDAALGGRCADGYDVARIALLGAEKAVDAYDAGAAGELPCAVARAAEGLALMSKAVQSAGAKVPPIVEDAFKLTPLLTVACRG